MMINIAQRKYQNDSINLNPQQVRHKIWEIGQLRRAKMHVSCLIEGIDQNCALTSAQRELLEASLTLQTISAKVLAAHLRRSPATIRSEFQQILSILGDTGRRSALHATEDEDFLYAQVSDK
ncbi:MAG: hypothetical protein K0U40_10545 [Betaproteobacteria bacterium]|nr:hypothetical protein [Betaproteobacteria bacterium]